MSRTLEAWARVLEALPGSRLALQAPAGRAQKHVSDLLGGQGIEPARLEFVPKRSHREYLELYHRLDIVLDPFPYNGHTTSLDALWMGVPVITLAGKDAVGRAGVSQLTNLGLPEFIAESEESYVAKAVQLAGRLDRLGELRRTLRPRMEASPVDGSRPDLREDIEDAYQTMWQRWCAGRTIASGS